MKPVSVIKWDTVLIKKKTIHNELFERPVGHDMEESISHARVSRNKKSERYRSSDTLAVLLAVAIGITI
jgi:hypothetical protein